MRSRLKHRYIRLLDYLSGGLITQKENEITQKENECLILWKVGEKWRSEAYAQQRRADQHKNALAAYKTKIADKAQLEDPQ